MTRTPFSSPMPTFTTSMMSHHDDNNGPCHHCTAISDDDWPQGDLLQVVACIWYVSICILTILTSLFFDVGSFYCLITPHCWSITKCGLCFDDIDHPSHLCIFFTILLPLIAGPSPSAACFNDINCPTSIQQAVMTTVATHDDNWP